MGSCAWLSTFVLHFARAAEKSPHEGQIPLITLRAIRAFGQLLKWRAIRYLPAGGKLWKKLHKLYRVAETEGFHRQPQRAYADDAADCSCETPGKVFQVHGAPEHRFIALGNPVERSEGWIRAVAEPASS